MRMQGALKTEEWPIAALHTRNAAMSFVAAAEEREHSGNSSSYRSS
jgi:hypothetical protein